jgi:lipoate-protein ligase A
MGVDSKDEGWRLIPLESHDCHYNMAMDQSIEEHVRTGLSRPTIRFYKWKPSAVSIGCFQSMDEEVNVERCDQLGIGYVRRRTGGGAVYHDAKGEITYSVIGDLSLFPKGIRESYALICGWIVAGLRNLGVNSEFVPINDIVTGGKKISGNAQTRRDGILLQHGTILYDLDVRTMFDVLKISKEKISDKMIKNVEDRVTCLKNISSASETELYKALVNGFCSRKEIIEEGASESEIRRAEELSKDVYGKRKWNFSK